MTGDNEVVYPAAKIVQVTYPLSSILFTILCWLLVIAVLQSHPHEHTTTAMGGLRANQEKTNERKKI